MLVPTILLPDNVPDKVISVTPVIGPDNTKLVKVPTLVILFCGPADKVPFNVVAVKVAADNVLIPLILLLEFNTNDLDACATPGVVILL